MNKRQFFKRYITRQTVSGPQWYTLFEGSKTINSSNTGWTSIASGFGLQNGETVRYRITFKCTKGAGYFSVSQYGTNKTGSGDLINGQVYEADITGNFASSSIVDIVRVYTDTNSTYQAGNNIRVSLYNNSLRAIYGKYTNSSANYSITMTITKFEVYK